MLQLAAIVEYIDIGIEEYNNESGNGAFSLSFVKEILSSKCISLSLSDTDFLISISDAEGLIQVR